MTGADRPVIGLVGCGRWGRHILRDLLQLGHPVTVMARDEATRNAALSLGAQHVVGTLDQLPVVAGIVIATPIDTHASVIDAVADRGVPIFVEKPFTSSLADAERLVRGDGDHIYVMEKWRYHPGVIELARLARAGALGSVRAVHTRRRGPENPQRDSDGTWVLAPHDLSIIDTILGRIPPVIRAAGVREQTGLEELSALLGDRGQIATIDLSTISVETERRVEVIGSEASAVLAGGWEERVLLRRRGSASVETISTPGELPLLAELREFSEHLSGGPPPRVTAADGMRVVAAIEALRASALSSPEALRVDAPARPR